MGLIGALIVWKFFHDTPESMGFPSVNVPKQKKEMSETETADFNKAQRQVLLMPAIWILALSSAFIVGAFFIWKLKRVTPPWMPVLSFLFVRSVA